MIPGQGRGRGGGLGWRSAGDDPRPHARDTGRGRPHNVLGSGYVVHDTSSPNAQILAAFERVRLMQDRAHPGPVAPPSRPPVRHQDTMNQPMPEYYQGTITSARREAVARLEAEERLRPARLEAMERLFNEVGEINRNLTTIMTGPDGQVQRILRLQEQRKELGRFNKINTVYYGRFFNSPSREERRSEDNLISNIQACDRRITDAFIALGMRREVIPSLESISGSIQLRDGDVDKFAVD